MDNNPYLNQAYHDGYADGRGWARYHEDPSIKRYHEDPLIKRTKEWEEHYQIGYEDGKGDHQLEGDRVYTIKMESQMNQGTKEELFRRWKLDG